MSIIAAQQANYMLHQLDTNTRQQICNCIFNFTKLAENLNMVDKIKLSCTQRILSALSRDSMVLKILLGRYSDAYNNIKMINVDPSTVDHILQWTYTLLCLLEHSMIGEYVVNLINSSPLGDKIMIASQIKQIICNIEGIIDNSYGTAC